MKENKYDDPAFFNQYSRMNRSVKGLEGAGGMPFPASNIAARQ